MSRVFRAVWEYLKSARGNGRYDTGWFLAFSGIMMIMSIGIVRNVFLGIEAGDWVLTALSVTLVFVTYLNVAVLLFAHFKIRTIRKRRDEENAIADLEDRMMAQKLCRGQGDGYIYSWRERAKAVLYHGPGRVFEEPLICRYPWKSTKIEHMR